VHRPRATFANVLSCLALFVALGGASYAAVELPRNSVGTKQIQPGAIDNGKVKKGSLLRTAFKAGQLPAAAPGVTGATGPAGPAGAKGDAGPPGSPGAAVADKLAALTPFAAQVLSADGQWYTWTSVTFTAAANTIYEPVYDEGTSQVTTTGSPGCATESNTRGRVNGVVQGSADSIGNFPVPQFFGPYPAGTAVTLDIQYQMLCATEMLHLPAGRTLLLQYLAP
jgi:hypothetical protein